MNPAVVDQLSVLSDAIRVRMLAILESRELTVSEICDVVQLPQSTVSRHLKTLLDGEWVTSRRDGTRRLYTLPLGELDDSAKRLWQVIREQVTSSAASSDDERRLKQVLERRKTQSEVFFSSAAGQWDRLREELFGPTSHLRALAGLLDSEEVVGDLGCGTGQVSQWLAPFSDRIIAVDASKEMLKAAREAAGLTQQQAAERSGVHFVSIARFETDVRTPTLATLIKRAMKLNEEGVTVPRMTRATPKPAIRMPADLKAALAKNKKASAAYAAFSPSHKREYSSGSPRPSRRRRGPGDSRRRSTG